MLGQAQYIKIVFSGVLNERCRMFLIKKCMPLLPTLGKYKDATELLSDLKKGGCDWYKEFLGEMKTATLPSLFDYTETDMVDYYRFAAFVASDIKKNHFTALWKDGTLKTKLKGTQPLDGEEIPGEWALQNWFIDVLDDILKKVFTVPGSYKGSKETWCTIYNKDKDWEIFDLDFYYAPGPCLTPEGDK
jgi:hypothetical protein